jgi:hypothetical protein
MVGGVGGSWGRPLVVNVPEVRKESFLCAPQRDRSERRRANQILLAKHLGYKKPLHLANTPLASGPLSPLASRSSLPFKP